MSRGFNPAMERIEGPRLVLRLITADDAEYVHALRTDPAYNRHLSEVQGSAADQRRWIEAYKKREAEGSEYYYVIERAPGQRCGVVRLYEMEAESFSWGSWILDDNKPHKAALESAFLVYCLAFDFLGLEKAQFEVRVDNEHTLSFHRRFGATEVGQDKENYYFVYTRDQFNAGRGRLLALLQRGARERA